MPPESHDFASHESIHGHEKDDQDSRVLSAYGSLIDVQIIIAIKSGSLQPVT